MTCRYPEMNRIPLTSMGCTTYTWQMAPAFVHSARICDPNRMRVPQTRSGRTKICAKVDGRSHDDREVMPATSRRTILKALVMLPVPLMANAAQSTLDFPELRGLDEKPDSLPPFRDVDGVKVQEIIVGKGAEVVDGSQVSVKYVLRRSNGYFIDASYGFDRFETYTFRAHSGDVIRGFDIALAGMREGGRKRFVVPPSLGYVAGTKQNNPGPIPPEFGPRRALASHVREPLIFEVVVVRVKPSVKD